MKVRSALVVCGALLSLGACTGSPLLSEEQAGRSAAGPHLENGGLIFGSGNRDGNPTEPQAGAQSQEEGDPERGGLIFGSGN